MRRPLIAANWKMNLGRPEEALALVRRLRPVLSRMSLTEVVLCPPFTVLAALAEGSPAGAIGVCRDKAPAVTAAHASFSAASE